MEIRRKVLAPKMIPEIVAEDFKSTVVKGIPNLEYHGDKSAVSSTSVKEVLVSGQAFLASHMGMDRKETPSMRLGTCLHMAILEPADFVRKVVVAPKFSGTGMKKAKEEWLESLPSEAIVLTEAQGEDLMGMVESVKRHPQAKQIFAGGGVAEMSGFYRDPVTGIKCKIRPDFYDEKRRLFLDVKSCQDVSAAEFAKTIFYRRYYLQMAMYKLGLEVMTGDKIRNPIFLAVSSNPPYECAVYMCDNEMMEIGLAEYQLAMGKLKGYITSNVWPALQEKAEYISLPKWSLNNRNFGIGE